MTENKNENIELRIEQPATPENVTQLENIEQVGCWVLFCARFPPREASILNK